MIFVQPGGAGSEEQNLPAVTMRDTDAELMMATRTRVPRGQVAPWSSFTRTAADNNRDSMSGSPGLIGDHALAAPVPVQFRDS